MSRSESGAYAKWKIEVDADQHGGYNLAGFGPGLSVQTHDRRSSEEHG
jgi:hypothetical protein